MNSAAGPVFNENDAEKWSLWDPWIVLWCTVHGRIGQKLRLKEKKKKRGRKTRNVEITDVRSCNQTDTMITITRFFFFGEKKSL